MKPAGPIHVLERDYLLKLDEPKWPPATLPILNLPKQPTNEQTKEPDRPEKRGKEPPWQAGPWHRVSVSGRSPTHLSRRLSKADSMGTEIAAQISLVENVIRFPSAPLFGIQRKRDYQYRMEPIHQHTFRLIQRPQTRPRSIDRIFIFLNGLNEIDHLGFYYELAGKLIASSPDLETACLVCPYPGHLTRYPMVGRYAEKPLQRFIMDPSDLFRQYLRFMIEMQWLLSILVPISYYPVAPGIPLLAESSPTDTADSRCDAEFLSESMFREWSRIHERSQQEVKGSTEGPALKKLREDAHTVTREDILQSIVTIRRLIRWRPAKAPLTAHPRERHLPKPAIHIVGYSLGGYLAQSAFFSWPFAISSCTSLCSGAALHTLRPVKMAHEEEWRAITHGLKYEIESGLLEGRIRLDPEALGDIEHPLDHRSVCGIRASYFSSHFQIFTDVFLQDPHGSYRPRVSEFAPRLLFVVGGNDPIVSTESVLEASPPEGINMIEIANLSHFIAVAEGEWSSFWLPTVANVVSSLADHSEGLLAASILYNLWNPETTEPANGEWPEDPPDHGANRPPRRDSEPLDSQRFRATLSEILDQLADGAFVFVLRNQIPFTLMGPRLLHRRGSAPHYEDFQLRRFWQQIQRWLGSMLDHHHRITLVIPGRLNEWFVKIPSILSGKSLPLARELPGRDSLARIWTDFLAKWEPTGALFRFDPQSGPTIPEEVYPLERLVRRHTATPPKHPVLNCLPDVWIGLSSTAATSLAGEVGRDGIHDAFLKKVLDAYIQRTTSNPTRTDGINWVRDSLKATDLRIIRVSAAQGSSRFLGERIWDPDDSLDLLVHSAMALARSTPCGRAGAFASGWTGQ